VTEPETSAFKWINELYVQPPPDLCPDCRAAPGQPHADGCEGVVPAPEEGGVICDLCDEPVHGGFTVQKNGDVTQLFHVECWERLQSRADIPLEVQRWVFESLVDVMVERGHDVIYDNFDEVRRVASERHREGFDAYGDRMYRWTAADRLANVIEELADAVVYLTSGPIE